MIGNVVISKIDALMCVALRKAEKTRSLRRISWNQRMYNTIDEVSHKPKVIVTKFNRIYEF